MQKKNFLYSHCLIHSISDSHVYKLIGGKKERNNVEYVMNSTDSRMMFYCQAAVDKHPSRRSGLWTKWIIQFCTYSHFKMLSKLCHISRYSELHLSATFCCYLRKVLFWKRCSQTNVLISGFFWHSATHRVHICIYCCTWWDNPEPARGIIFWISNIIQSLTRFSLILPCDRTLWNYIRDFK